MLSSIAINHNPIRDTSAISAVGYCVFVVEYCDMVVEYCDVTVEYCEFAVGYCDDSVEYCEIAVEHCDIWAVVSNIAIFWNLKISPYEL